MLQQRRRSEPLSKCSFEPIRCFVQCLGADMRRREFLGVLSGAAAWPAVAHAQQATPIIGFLSGRSPGESRVNIAAFQDGLSEAGFAEGRNVAIAFQWADGQYDRLPGQAADLVRLRVVSIVAVGATQAILAAKAATATIP